MAPLPFSTGPLWAVHISDGVLAWPWLAGGFALAAGLALLAAYRVRDEEVPRIALLTAAFFVASSIHVKLGPSSTHLLLNGLVGVVLGRRAPLAILLGVALQAFLIPHGGLWAIGVNTCTEALPALLAGWLFGLLHRAPWARQGWFRAVLVAASAVLWAGSLVFAAVVLGTNPLGQLVGATDRAGLVLSALDVGPAERVLSHPVTWALLAVFGAACAWGERRLGNAPEFPLGLLIGVVSVLATATLAGLVLLLGGPDGWQTFVTVLFLGHLPLALLEGLVLGCTVGFLARVKPEMLGLAAPTVARDAPQPDERPQPLTAVTARPPALLLAVGALLLTAGPAQAHDLKADYQVDVAKKSVQVESWFETGAAPRQATVEVRRDDGSILAKGALDAKGAFVFAYAKPEPLQVIVLAPGGHRAELRIPAKALRTPEAPALGEEVAQARGELQRLREELAQARADAARPRAEDQPDDRSRARNLLLGVSFVLALAAFVVALRNASQLRRLRRGLPTLRQEAEEAIQAERGPAHG
jgi:cobalt/nickel transport system permease protein